MKSVFAAELKHRIEREYATSGYSLGWRLLYSPAVVLEGARAAFIGINPGGSYRPKDHAEFAMEHGSAYAVESWKAAPGQDKLQRQVLALFERIGERPEAVLAGNLVPFRSPSWKALAAKQRALAFGKDLWRDILAAANPQLVICIDSNVLPALRGILDVREMKRIPIGWGDICGERGEFANGTLIRIPHLSRFGIITRAESQAGLSKLLPVTGTNS